MKPMMWPEEIPILMQCVKDLPLNSKIVEWGSGGSTTLFVETMRPDQQLISIEHSEKWFNEVSINLKNLSQTNWTYLHKPEHPEYVHGYGIPHEENPVGLADYIFPGEFVLDADLYFIDGVARSSIALMLLAKAKKRNAVIFLHDYSPNRSFWYNWSAKLFPTAGIHGTSLLKLGMI